MENRFTLTRAILQTVVDVCKDELGHVPFVALSAAVLSGDAVAKFALADEIRSGTGDAEKLEAMARDVLML